MCPDKIKLDLAGRKLGLKTVVFSPCRNYGLVKVESTYQAYMVEVSYSCKLHRNVAIFLGTLQVKVVVRFVCRETAMC